MFPISCRSSLKRTKGVEFSPSFVIREEMVSTSHLDYLRILNIFSERKQIDFLSVVKWLEFYCDWIFFHFHIFKTSLPELYYFWLSYFWLQSYIFFCFDMWEKSNTGVKTQDKRKPAIPRSLTACMAMKQLVRSQAASDHGLHLLLWPCQASYKAAGSPSVLFFVCVCSLNIFGKGENIYPQMHIIISGLLGYIIRVSKAWILFSLLLTNFSKCNSKANWPCVLLEASKCPTRCPWHISSLNSTC